MRTCTCRHIDCEHTPHAEGPCNRPGCPCKRFYDEDLAEIDILRGAIKAQEERDLAATQRLGIPPLGCDTSEHLADEIQRLRKLCGEAAAAVATLAELAFYLRCQETAKTYRVLAERLRAAAEGE